MAVLHRARIMTWPAVLCVAATAVYLCLGCVGPRPAVSSPEPRVERLEQQLILETRREETAIAHRSRLYQDPQLEQFFEQVLASLVPAEVPEGARLRVLLVSGPSLDAFSFPDGAIYLHTGLCARLQNESELALLLAHEMVHIIRQHALRALVACPPQTELPFLNRLLSDSLSWFENTPAPAGRGGTSDEQLSLRRSLEQEADRMGLDMVIQAGYDPYEALEIFDNLIEGDGNQNGKERAAALRRALSTLGRDRPGGLTDRSAFGKHLQALVLDEGWLELRYGRWDGALQCARRVVRDAPTHARGHFLLGEILRRRNEPGDVPEALLHYFQAIASEPPFPDPYKAIGLIHFKQGHTRLARSFFEKALALAPHAPDNDYIRSYLAQCTLIPEGEDP